MVGWCYSYVNTLLHSKLQMVLSKNRLRFQLFQSVIPLIKYVPFISMILKNIKWG